MNDDLDRWVNLEGPPPQGVREVLDILVPPMSPEKEAELDRKLYAAIAEDERREAQQRRGNWTAAAVFLAAVLVAVAGGAVVVAMRDDASELDTSRSTDVARVSRTPVAAPDGGGVPPVVPSAKPFHRGPASVPRLPPDGG